MKSVRQRKIAAAVCSLFFVIAPGVSQVRLTKQEALHAYFPDAQIRRQTAYLTPEQVDGIRRSARAPVDSRIVTYYTAFNGRELLGTAFLETVTVRTMPATYMVVVSPDTAVRAVEILAFYEPPDYAPPDRWLAQFQRETAEEDLFLKRGIQNIAGATLSARAITEGVRRILASYRIIVAPTVCER